MEETCIKKNGSLRWLGVGRVRAATYRGIYLPMSDPYDRLNSGDRIPNACNGNETCL